MKYIYGNKLVGVGHDSSGKPCQDAFAFANSGFALIACVCDGVGSQKNSDLGSQTASDACVTHCANNLKQGMKDSEIFKMAESAFDFAWRSVVEKASRNRKDIYQCDTTMTLGILVGGDLFYGHVGDSGMFALFDDGCIRPATVQQNDAEGRVFPLRFTNMWKFGKTPGKVAAAILCTDGIWSMLHPKRPEGSQIRYSIPLVDYYIDPGFIPRRCPDGKEETLQRWLESEMRLINKEHAAEVNYDDITIAIMQDTDISISYQPDEYYAVPNIAVIEEPEKTVQAKKPEARKQEILPAPESPKRYAAKAQASGAPAPLPAKAQKRGVITLNEVLNYDPDYKMSIRTRVRLAIAIFKTMNKNENKLPANSLISISKFNIATTNELSANVAAMFVFRLVANGIGCKNANKGFVYLDETVARRGNESVPPASFLDDQLRKSFKEASEGASSFMTAGDWVDALEKYEAKLVDCKANKKHSYLIQLRACPWCEFDKKKRLQMGK
ncbi:MAG: protein phosphatase 2C domain-containing protein [Clostridiales bacterium]|nr:protein phosphatase 2C domain-containing protein [Clostridiales bacterium]